MAGASARAGGWRWLYAAGWLAYLTLYQGSLAANGVPVGLAFRGAVANVLPDALLGLLLLRVPPRLPWSEARRGRFFAAHLGWLTLFLLAATAGWLALWAFDRRIFEGVWNLRFDLRILPWRIANELVLYCALVGIAYAWQQVQARRELAARVARSETLRVRAELEAMRSQLNPHFVLNTLHALVGLVRRDPAVAEEALERLGGLLRHSLRIQREARDEIPLREEWSLVEGYVDLERLRLGSRLRVRLDLDDDSLDAAVPSFALQTLVENAIRHGIAPRAQGGALAVSASCRDGVLRVEVENDAGPPADATAGDGIGLRLLRDRLAALHAGRARLELEREGGRYRATLEIPAVAGEEEA